jgi:protein-disulfide isomerase
MDNRNLLIGGGVAAVLLLAGAGYWITRAPSDEPAKSETASAKPEPEKVADAGACQVKPITVSADDFVVGDAKAPLTLVEYYSQTCSHCADFHKQTFPKLNEAYIKTGVVRLVLRDFQRNQVDLAASVVGRCMGQAQFLPFTHLLLEEQETWLLRADQDVRQGLKDMAKRAGMSGDAFEACMKKEAEAKKLADALEQTAKDNCIDGTPTLILNGKKLEKAQAFEALEVFIKDEMKAMSVTLPKAEGAAPKADTN